MKSVFVFDVDGTLVNSLPHIYSSYCKACKKIKIREPLIEDFRHAYDQSNNFRNCARKIGVPEEKIDEFNYTVYEFFKKEIKERKPELIPGVVDTLYELKRRGITMKILSLELYENTIYKLGEKIVKDIFDEIVIPHEGKPLALKKLKQSIRENIFYIGDCVSDGYAAIEAETDFIGLANDYSYSHPIRMIEFVKLNAEKAKHVSNFIDIIKI